MPAHFSGPTFLRTLYQEAMNATIRHSYGCKLHSLLYVPGRVRHDLYSLPHRGDVHEQAGNGRGGLGVATCVGMHIGSGAAAGLCNGCGAGFRHGRRHTAPLRYSHLAARCKPVACCSLALFLRGALKRRNQPVKLLLMAVWLQRHSASNADGSTM